MDERSSASRPRSPAVVHIALSMAILLLVAIAALTTRQQQPPSIAEFAPQAVEQITDAPAEQSSEFGSGAGGGGQAAGAPTPAPAVSRPDRPFVDVPRTRRCVGSPPRQIEDPQSPPCVPYFAGDNGGATWEGVTADEIRVMIPTTDGQRPFFEALRRFFNSRFEFYGRQLVFAYGRDDIGSASPQTQRAEAQAAKEQHKVFASTFYRGAQGFYYHDELARLRVLNATGAYFPNERDYVQERRPYTWQYLMAADDMFRNLGEWACKRLVGGKAVHGGDAVAGRERVFGIALQTYHDGDQTGPDGLEAELGTCDAWSAFTVRNGVRQDAGGEATQASAVDPVTSSNVMLRMQEAGVTTVFCLCQLFTTGALMKAATNQGYFPEWVLSSYGPNDINSAILLGSFPPEQIEHAFGLNLQPRQVAPANEPYRWAAREGDPAYSDDGTANAIGNRSEIYRPLLLLASGIQMAGPVLTPETFEAGLHRTTFPNPAHPNMAGEVGFGRRGYSMTTDGAEIWWSNEAQSPYAGDRGTWCWVDGGRRHRKGSWPEDGRDPFFKGSCDTGA